MSSEDGRALVHIPRFCAMISLLGSANDCKKSSLSAVATLLTLNLLDHVAQAPEQHAWQLASVAEPSLIEGPTQNCSILGPSATSLDWHTQIMNIWPPKSKEAQEA